MRGNEGVMGCRRWTPLLVAMLAFGTACHDEPTAPTSEVKTFRNPTMEEVLQGPVVLVSTGKSGSHACAIGGDGVVSCWGSNYYGQAAPQSGTFVAVSAGGEHTCGLRPDGTVHCGGQNKR